jgi:type 1 glutamine amidotransferase
LSRKALIVWGGWDGHEPEKVAHIFANALEKHQFDVEISTTLDSFSNAENLLSMDLIVPIYTMSTITPAQLQPLLEAVKSGVGIGGCHGGMCDAFRNETEYQFMTGGQWVAHPGNDRTDYRVKITDHDHYITRGVKDFDVCSEQYYMHIDPAIRVYAVTQFPVADGPHVPNGIVQMPVVWTKYYGKGRVFYTSLGHHADVIETEPALGICTRGLLWAACAAEADEPSRSTSDSAVL